MIVSVVFQPLAVEIITLLFSGRAIICVAYLPEPKAGYGMM